MARKGTIKNMGKVKNEMSDAWKARKASKSAAPANAPTKTERIRKGKAPAAGIDQARENAIRKLRGDVSAASEAVVPPTADAQSLESGGAAKPAPAPKRMSALDAAAKVLAESKVPMRTTDMIAEMAKQNLWTSPGGKTPAATLHAAIGREILTKGDASRFRKAERGLFAAAV